MSIVKVVIKRDKDIIDNISKNIYEKTEIKMAEQFEKKLSPIINEIKKEKGSITITLDNNSTKANIDGFSDSLEKKILSLLKP